MKIGILQTGRSPEELRCTHGDYDDMFKRLLGGRGFDFVTYPVLDGIFPLNIQEADGWLVTGSRHGVYEDLPWISLLEDLLRRAYAASVPIVGVCFGHQILAQALGGKVEKFTGGWSVGAQNYAIDGVGADVSLLAWHRDQITDKPNVATVVGSSAFCRFAALAYGDRAFTIQPHPEFRSDFFIDLIAARSNILPAAVAGTALNGLERETASAAIADRMEDVFKRRRRATPN
ncbi:type 1 glutamine amidotransferase [Mesorhizobium sp. VK23B]|uniref:Type 1 glutamine amidotransferase n=1 Tax=Mesorhizobium dulcispinae TaxID=3072316 RepID=A0ABU4XB74_9HYPH|nr:MULTISPECIES: type 1 glutamine amidotransferase [unclassified Mesorhizobium]MDX8464634.1 type 1 glutamine amidotransferase [Mesorhizobium sp. VK23B]MDX8471020.1 type 1 glutamine amidotransferase [Mesorhizobium sp. VK23A]